MNGYVWAIIIYALFLILIGFITSRFVKGSSDFFVAGRRFTPALLFATMIASNIGGGSTVGVAGIGYQFGFSGFWWIMSAAVGSLILAFFVGPKIWEASMKYNLFTLGDYLDHRYAKSFRGMISLMMAIGTLALFAGQLMGVAWILGAVAGVSKATGVIIAATAVTLYFMSGGLFSAAIVNSIEVVVKFFGFIIAVPFVLSYVGGWSGLHTMVANNFADPAKTAAYFSWNGIGTTTIIGYFLMLAPSFFVSPGLIGKVFGANSASTVKKGTFMNAIVLFIFSFVPSIIGMAAFAVFPGLTNRELALPMAMKNFMPFWASALALAAIFSAEISAADAVLYMLTSSFTKDLYKTFIKPDISDASLLKLSRIVTVTSGVLGVCIALLLPNIITALSIFYSLMSVSLTAPLLFGLFSKRPSVAAAFTSALVGIATTVILQFGNGGKGIWILNAQSTGILLTLVVMVVMMYALPAKAFKEAQVNSSGK